MKRRALERHLRKHGAEPFDEGATTRNGAVPPVDARLFHAITDEAEHTEAIDELVPQLEAAFSGLSFCGLFVKRAHVAEIERLSEWLEGTGRIVAEQFRRRGPRSVRPADMRLSTAPMDGLIHPIRDSIRPRAYGLKNRERTNPMLLLMQLHANRNDDERAYVSHIRGWRGPTTGARPSPAARSPMPAGSCRCVDPPATSMSDIQSSRVPASNASSLAFWC